MSFSWSIDCSCVHTYACVCACACLGVEESNRSGAYGEKKMQFPFGGLSLSEMRRKADTYLNKRKSIHNRYLQVYRSLLFFIIYFSKLEKNENLLRLFFSWMHIVILASDRLEKSDWQTRRLVTPRSHYGLFPLKCVICVKWENLHFLHRVCLLLLIESTQSFNKRACISTHISSQWCSVAFRSPYPATVLNGESFNIAFSPSVILSNHMVCKAS